jgi:predicted glycoside hydrolase/deacetylase ChbG (UPF0249 family)
MKPSQCPNTIIAHDWGLTPGVNTAILEMAQRGLIKQVSILAGSPFVKNGLDELLQIPGLQFGLHFNLTLFPPLFEEQQDAFSPFLDPSCFHYKPLWKLKWIWFLPFRKKDKMLAATDAFKGQLEKLRSLKVPISYFDGHQNVHLLPGLLEALEPELKKWGIKEVKIPSVFRLLVKRRILAARTMWIGKMRAKKIGLNVKTTFRPSISKLSQLKFKPYSLDIIVRPAAVHDLDGYGIRDRYQEGRVQEYRALCQLLQSFSV